MSHPPTNSSVSGTPVKLTIRNHNSVSQTVPSVDQFRQNFCRELSPRSIVGPMDNRGFMDKFFPLPAGTPSLDEQTLELFSTMRTDFKDEHGPEGMSTEILRRLNLSSNPDDPQSPTFAELIFGDLISLVDTEEHKDKNSRNKLAPDMSLYPKAVATKAIENARRTQFDHMLMWIELKLNREHHPFLDPIPGTGEYTDREKTEFVSEDIEHKNVRGQLISYATELNSRQNRLHQFSLYISNDEVRFYRWDQAGVIVSEGFSYAQNSELLVEFLWRFSHLSPKDQGSDPTISAPTDDEEKLAKSKLAAWEVKGLERAVWKVHVEDPETKKRHDVLIWHALSERDSVVGRGTRGYPCVDIESGNVMFLKDYWRDHSTVAESLTIKLLNSKQVQYAPTFVCGGDIPGQETDTQNFLREKWRCAEPADERGEAVRQRFHHRLLLKEVGNRLNDFQSSKQLHVVVLHAIICHEQAVGKCKILHRDISGGNILIQTNGDGLIDWDLARPLVELLEGSKQFERTGTWQYMSVGLLAEPSKVHEVADDLESFVHVQMHHALCYIASSLDKSNLHQLVTQIYNEYVANPDTGEVKGGNHKRLFVTNPQIRIPNGLQFDACPSLSRWFQDAIEITGARLRALDNINRAQIPKVEDDSDDHYDEDSDDDDDELPPPPAPAAVNVPLYNHSVLRKLWKRHANSSQWPTVGIPAKAQLPTSTELRKGKGKKRLHGDDEEGSLGGSDSKRRSRGGASIGSAGENQKTSRGGNKGSEGASKRR
ncbi:hypothetical protein C8J56DRAFT_892821 [Mycena floridula]|nr:hypothetical protein C8J56DRAFT_892821 [Mycena floridula]